MKLATKIRFGFIIIFIGMIIQSLVTYTNVASIGSELEEISEYQVPINTLVMELEKDILKEEVLTYKLFVYANNVHSDEFLAIEKEIEAVEHDTDKKLKKVLTVIDAAIAHAHEGDIKAKYMDMNKLFKQIAIQQAQFEKTLKELEHNLETGIVAKTAEYKQEIEQLLHEMDKEVVSIVKIMEHLLETSTQQALEDERSVINIVIWANILVFILINIISFIIVSQFNKSMNKINNYIEHIATKNDLSTAIDTNADDEVGVMSQNLNRLIASLRDTISNAKQSSMENASISNELSTTSLSVGNNVEASVGIIGTAVDKAQELQEEISQSIDDANESKKGICTANDTLVDAKDNIVNLTKKVQETAEIEMDIAENMNALSNDANEVKNVLTVISDIADQTNLLALNAAIEAARAGEHGRGFAVVADEVRKLAERTQKTLSEINATINVVVQAIGDASTRIGSNAQETQELAELAQSVEEKINFTVDMVKQASVASDKTVQDFAKTGNDVREIVAEVEEINSISSANARSVEEISAAAEHLNNLTSNLTTQLEEFST